MTIEEKIIHEIIVSEMDGPVWDAVCAAKAAGRGWKWDEAEKNLNRAYRLVGGKNPGSGYAWHCGDHPLQAAIDASPHGREIWM